MGRAALFEIDGIHLHTSIKSCSLSPTALKRAVGSRRAEGARELRFRALCS